MKKVVQINSVCNGSTGKIMYYIQKTANDFGYETLSIHGRRKSYKDIKCKKFGNIFSFLFHVLITFVFNKHNHGSYFQTKRLVDFLKKYNPDIIHLHNIHGYYLNNKILFNYLNKDFKGKIIWTLHDCWTFTGHCAHFDYEKCSKWKKECKKCSLKHVYPYSWFFDTSNKEFNNKKELFSNLNNLTIVTPSIWLKNKVKDSFFKKHECIVINNGIDLNIFKPNIDNNVFVKYNIPKNKKIILGVASVWTSKKGYNTFINLSSKLSSNVIIIMVGLTKKQVKYLPKNIIGIERTENVKELVSLYSLADIFVNPTLEDTYPTTNLEAIACGTPVICYNTGGCIEQINNKVGKIVMNNNIKELLNQVNLFLKDDFKNKNFNNIDILKKIDSKNKYKEYMKLYEKGDM